MESESGLEQLVRQQARALEAASAALRQSEQILAMELDAAQRLHHVATQLINANGIEVLYDQILDASMSILHADFASIQILYPERGTNGELGSWATAGSTLKPPSAGNGYDGLLALPAVRLCAPVGGLSSRMSGIAISCREAKIWNNTLARESTLYRTLR